MAHRTKVTGTRSCLLWLLRAIVVVLIAMLVAGGLILYPRYQAQQRAEQNYQAGVAFQAVGAWEAAEAEFKQVVTIDANYKDVQARLAEVKAKLTESKATATAAAKAQAEQARADAQATAAAAPTATAEALEAHYQKGLGYMNMGRWEEAKAELERVFDTDPNYKEVQAKLANVETELAKLGPTATPTSVATATPTVTPTSPIVTFKPKLAISFQDEGTTSTDNTALVQEKDGFWAPSLTGTVIYDYLATGTDAEFFDALSLQFDVGDRSYQDYRAVLLIRTLTSNQACLVDAATDDILLVS